MHWLWNWPPSSAALSPSLRRFFLRCLWCCFIVGFNIQLLWSDVFFILSSWQKSDRSTTETWALPVTEFPKSKFEFDFLVVDCLRPAALCEMSGVELHALEQLFRNVFILRGRFVSTAALQFLFSHRFVFYKTQSFVNSFLHSLFQRFLPFVIQSNLWAFPLPSSFPTSFTSSSCPRCWPNWLRAKWQHLPCWPNVVMSCRWAPPALAAADFTFAAAMRRYTSLSLSHFPPSPHLLSSLSTRPSSLCSTFARRFILDFTTLHLHLLSIFSSVSTIFAPNIIVSFHHPPSPPFLVSLTKF